MSQTSYTWLMYLEHTIILYSYSRGRQLFSGPKAGPVFFLHRLTGGQSEWFHRKRPKPFWVMSQISLSITLISRLHLEEILRPKKISELDYRTLSVNWLTCKRGPEKIDDPRSKTEIPLLVKKNNRSLKVSKVWKNLKVISRQRASQDSDTKKWNHMSAL